MNTTAREGRVESLDLLIGILKFVYARREEIPCSTPSLQNAVYALSKKPEFIDFFQEYRFQDCGYYQYSEELLGDFRNLERLGCLSAGNPLFVRYAIRKSVVEGFYKNKQESGVFNSISHEQFNQMAVELDQYWKNTEEAR